VLDRWNFPRRRAIGPDDVAFFVAMTRWLASHDCVDRGSVFLTGFSDGADMAGTAACAEPSLVRAVAEVAASVIPRSCRGPVDVLQIHGDRDPIVPFEGGGGDRGAPFEGNEAVSALAQLHAWERVDGCAQSQHRRTVAPDVDLLVARSCSSGHVAELMVVHGGGHTWPGAAMSLPYGATTHAVSATRQILYFFQQMRRG
jgi:polyhydroxybutyrate depolymerase